MTRPSILVIDASVIIKWLFRDPEREGDTAQATALMAAVARGTRAVLQPPHWLVEVAAVLARETPERAQHDLALLDAMALPLRGDAAVLKRACALAIDLEHHLFDTLYHALALECEACLITADERYLRKAASLAGIRHLRAWSADGPVPAPGSRPGTAYCAWDDHAAASALTRARGSEILPRRRL